MLSSILAASFETFWELEGQPSVTILKNNISTNNPTAISNIMSTTPYVVMMADIPCISAGGPVKGQLEDNTTKVDLTLVIKESSLTSPFSQKFVFKFENRLYKLTTIDPNRIYGLLEIDLIRAD